MSDKYKLMYYRRNNEPSEFPDDKESSIKSCDYCGHDVPLADFGAVNKHDRWLCQFCAECYLDYSPTDVRSIKIHINKMMNVLWSKIESKLNETH